MTDTIEPEAAMTPLQLAELRNAMRYTQVQMAEAMGLSRRAYLDIEHGGTLRKIHQLAAERVALAHAARHVSVTAAPQNVIEDAVKLANAWHSLPG